MEFQDVAVNLTDIYTYIALDDPAAAERFVDDLVPQMYKIAELGLSASPRGVAERAPPLLRGACVPSRPV